MCLAIPGKIVELDAQNAHLAVVDVVGVRRKVDLGLLQDVSPAPGDWVLIHVGFAMSKISEADAKDQLRALEALGESAAVLEEVRGYELGEENHLLDENGSTHALSALGSATERLGLAKEPGGSE